MRLFALSSLTMLAFAANSVLNRMAVGDGEINALSFAIIRVGSGAITLALLALVLRRGLPILGPGRIIGATSLSLYLLGFSIAYTRLDAGLGALILFGGVQITMFAGALWGREAVPRRRWIGAGLALAGLAWLLWPAGAVQVPVIAGVAMGLAALGWGIYSLIGRRAVDPLAETAANFVLAVPICVAPIFFLPAMLDADPTTTRGIVLAVISGAVTSGLGYALWYSLLPRLGATSAGLLQLTVPVLAVLGGVAFLGEGVSLRLVASGVLVLGGVAYGLGAFQRMIGSRGS